MAGVLDWGVQVILWLQRWSPGLDIPFRMFTALGDEAFFLLLLPLIYWCFDRRLGARAILLFLFSAYINSLLKDLAGQPRPFLYDPRVQALVPAGGGGFPSGHTQNTVVFWGYLAWQVRSSPLRAVCWALILLVPLSRIYLGVHFPSDVAGGYLIGAMLLWFYGRLEPAVETTLAKAGAKVQGLTAMAVALLMVSAVPGDCRNCLSAAAALGGMACGFVLERRLVGFDVAGSRGQRILRFLLGGAVMVFLWAGLRWLFEGWPPEELWRLVRYGGVGFWGALGAPWVFQRCNLLEKPSRALEGGPEGDAGR